MIVCDAIRVSAKSFLQQVIIAAAESPEKDKPDMAAFFTKAHVLLRNPIVIG
jgi:hypothetical protein